MLGPRVINWKIKTLQCSSEGLLNDKHGYYGSRETLPPRDTQAQWTLYRG